MNDRVQFPRMTLTPHSQAKLERLQKLMSVPPVMQDPNEITRNLMTWRNERVLYRRKCDVTGEPLISAYPADAPFPVIKNELWWGDSWDPLDYGQEIDFTRPFFEQFRDLQRRVPREGTSVFQSENCAYNSHIRESRNCYLSALVYRCEDTHYSLLGGKRQGHRRLFSYEQQRAFL